MNDRRHDFYPGLRPGANANCSLKRFIKLEPAIRITRGIFGYSANINAPGADYFGPTRADREQVRIAKWNVTTRDFLRGQIGFGNWDGRVSQRRAADCFQVFDRSNQSLVDG